MFCPKCRYERPGCQCENPIFPLSPMELKAALYQILQNQGAIMVKLRTMPGCEGSLIEEINKSTFDNLIEKTGKVMKLLA